MLLALKSYPSFLVLYCFKFLVNYLMKLGFIHIEIFGISLKIFFDILLILVKKGSIFFQIDICCRFIALVDKLKMGCSGPALHKRKSNFLLVYCFLGLLIYCILTMLYFQMLVSCGEALLQLHHGFSFFSLFPLFFVWAKKKKKEKRR